jgi:hypothetical protein
MKRHATFDEYAADQPPKNRTMIAARRRFVRVSRPALAGDGQGPQGSARVGDRCRRRIHQMLDGQRVTAGIPAR